jgi:hypothetical protein
MAAIRDAAFEGGGGMSYLLKKLNEIEARHAAELKELRRELKKQRGRDDEHEWIIGRMFKIDTIGPSSFLRDKHADKMELALEQPSQLRAVENILQAAHKRTAGNMELYDAFKEAEKLGLKF